jgi:uncharacterized protein (TIGR02246 family)
LFFSSTSAAQERREVAAMRTYGEPSTADRTAVETLLEQYKDAWFRQDTEAYIALHAEDTEWINAYARMFQGAAPLADFIENRLFPAFDSSTSRQEIRNMQTVSIRYLGDDAAVIHTYTEGQRGPSRNEDEELRRTHVHLVLGKQNGVWKIFHTAIMDAR